MAGSFSYDPRSIALCMATFGFRGTIAPEANGPLWSLVIEMRCYVAAGLLAQIGLSRTQLGKVTCVGALVCVLSLMAYDRHMHPAFTLSYAAFAFGLVLSLAARQIPQMIPAVPIDISYSLYILHMPIMLGSYFVFYQPSLPSFSGALALSCAAAGSALALSLFSARFIEPFRGQALATTCEKFLATGGFRFLSRRPPIGSASFEGSIASDA
jgi:peptidoglycan/LPS O-acetylase OafA/YrhL